MNLKFSTNVALAYNVSAAWRSGGLKCTNVELKNKGTKKETKLKTCTEPAILPNCLLCVAFLSVTNYY